MEKERFYKTRYEVLRRTLMLAFGFFNGSRLSLTNNLLSLVTYSVYSLISRRSILVEFKTAKRGIFVRTQTSDLEVFFQHFIHRELEHKSLLNHSFEIVVDAGAYTGMTALVFLELFPTAEIYAIEPDLSNLSVLRKNCQSEVELGKVKLFEGALYYQNEIAKPLYIVSGDEDWSNSISELGGSRLANNQVFSLSDFCFPDNRNVLYKIDIEGAELTLFEDPKIVEILTSHYLLIELHGGKTHLEFFSLLKSLGPVNVSKVGEYWLTLPLKRKARK